MKTRTLGWRTKAVRKKSPVREIDFPSVFFNIPSETLLDILRYLEKQELLIFSMVCTAFHSFGVSEGLFKRVDWSYVDYTRPLSGFHPSPIAQSENKIFPLPNGDMVCMNDNGLMHFDFKSLSWKALQLDGWVEMLNTALFNISQFYLFKNKLIMMKTYEGICIWDRTTGRKVQFLPCCKYDLRGCGFILLENEIKTISALGRINVWTYDDRKNISIPFSLKSSSELTHKRKNGDILYMCLRKLDGDRGIFETSSDKTFIVWDFNTNQLVAEWPRENLLKCLNLGPQATFDDITFCWSKPCVPGGVLFKIDLPRGIGTYLLNFNNPESKPLFIGYSYHVIEGSCNYISRVTEDGDFVVARWDYFNLYVHSNWCTQTNTFKSGKPFVLMGVGVRKCCFLSDGNIFVHTKNGLLGNQDPIMFTWNYKTNEYLQFALSRPHWHDIRWLSSGDLLLIPGRNSPMLIVDGRSGKIKHSINQMRVRLLTCKSAIYLLADGSLAINWSVDYLDKRQYMTEVHRFGIWKRPETDRFNTGSHHSASITPHH